MKKTEKTALTAAIFAAAMCGAANTASEPVEAAAYSSTTTVVGAEFAESLPAISPDSIKELNLKMAALYGPPPSYDNDNNSDEDVVTTTRKITTVYGPPRTTTTPVPNEQATTTDFVLVEVQQNTQPVYGPVPALGDLDYNGKVDVFDLILLRERFVENNTVYKYTADVNNDKKISVADLVVLNQFLLGKIDRDEPAETTTTTAPEEDDVITETTRTQPAYGAPVWITTTAPDEDDVITDTTRTQPVYGAPVWITTTALEEDDVTETTRNELVGVYGPPPSYSTTTVADEE